MIPIINKHPPSHRYKKRKVYLLVMGTLWTFNFQIYHITVLTVVAMLYTIS